MGDFDLICLQEVAVDFPGLPGSRGEDQMAELSASLPGSRGEDQMAELSASLPGYTALYGAATDVPNTHGGHSGSRQQTSSE